MKQIFKVIPQYPLYAITDDGYIQDTVNGKIYHPQVRNTSVNKYYPQFTLKRYSNTKTAVHILVASAWVPKTNPHANYVDHVNGLKHDCRASNLRWVTQAENNAYAVDQGLNKQAVPVILTDVSTGEEKTFNSITAATKWCGRSRVNRHFRYSNTWKTPKGTFYSNVIDIRGIPLDLKRCYVAEICKDGELYHCNNIIALQKTLGIQTVECGIEVLAKAYMFKVLFNNDSRLPYVVGLKDNQLSLFTTIANASEQTSVPDVCVSKSVGNNGAYEYSGWRFKYDNGYGFSPLVDIQNRPQAVILRNTKTNEVMKFPSYRAAGVYLKVTHRVIRTAARKQKELKGYIITLTEPHIIER